MSNIVINLTAQLRAYSKFGLNVDSELNKDSHNPVENAAIAAAFDAINNYYKIGDYILYFERDGVSYNVRASYSPSTTNVQGDE